MDTVTFIVYIETKINDDDKKAKDTKTCVIKRKYNVFTEEVNKIGLSANDDKKIQATNSIETYAYGTSKD